MRRVLAWAAVAALVTASLALALRPQGGSPTASVDAVAASLRCPVCQGLSVKDSDSPTARDIRADIERRLAAGETPAEVRSAYVDRYGKWILLRPGTSGFEVVVWALPAAVAGAGGVGIATAFWRWRRRNDTRAPTSGERDLVEAALAASAGASP